MAAGEVVDHDHRHHVDEENTRPTIVTDVAAPVHQTLAVPHHVVAPLVRHLDITMVVVVAAVEEDQSHLVVDHPLPVDIAAPTVTTLHRPASE